MTGFIFFPRGVGLLALDTNLAKKTYTFLSFHKEVQSKSFEPLCVFIYKVFEFKLVYWLIQAV
jgi:hypothetical protein